MNWLADKYGKDNIIEATIHYDELTPHLTALVVPLKDEKLNAFHYIGSRQKLRDDQTSYAKCVSHLGLERGIEGSKAQHKTVKQFYKELETKDQNIPTIAPQELKPQKLKGETITEKLFGAVETEYGVTVRLNQKIQQAVSPIASNVLNDRLKAQRLDSIERIATNSQNELQRIKNAFKELSTQDIITIGEAITIKREQKLKEKQHQIQEITRSRGRNR